MPMMHLESMHEHSKLWRVPRLEHLTILHARYITQTFARHTHDELAIGIIEQGAMAFAYRGAWLVAPSGSVGLLNPGTPHTGHAAMQDSWTYRMLYIQPELLQQVAADMADRPRDMPFFQAGVLHDPILAQHIVQLHYSLEHPPTTGLEHESSVAGDANPSHSLARR